MSKRFTDDEKWQDVWFRRLKPAHKLFWLYLCDACDRVGVWEPDLDAAAFVMGAKVNADEARTAFGDRITVLPNGRWHLTKFLAFQYPNGVGADSKPHAALRATLAHHGLSVSVASGATTGSVFSSPKGMGKPLEDSPEAYLSLQDKNKNKDKETDKETDKTREVVGGPEAEWPYVRREPWAVAVARVVGNQIAKSNWPAWKRLVDLRGLDVVLATMEGMPAQARWPNRVEDAMPQIGDLPPADPELEQVAGLIRYHGWEACRDAIGIGNVPDASTLARALDCNRPLLRKLIAHYAQQGAA